MRKKKIIFSTLTAIAVLVSPAQAAVQSKAGSATGPSGQTLKVSNVTNLRDGQKVNVVGKSYDQKLGIYVAFCEIPAPGAVPENCSGGVNLNGKSSGSVWVSSNPPLYGKLLAKKFKKNGSFNVNIKVSRMIGNTDCKVAKCAIITRADHTNAGIRSADVFVPVTFK